MRERLEQAVEAGHGLFIGLVPGLRSSAWCPGSVPAHASTSKAIAQGHATALNSCAARWPVPVNSICDGRYDKYKPWGALA